MTINADKFTPVDSTSIPTGMLNIYKEISFVNSVLNFIDFNLFLISVIRGYFRCSRNGMGLAHQKEHRGGNPLSARWCRV